MSDETYFNLCYWSEGTPEQLHNLKAHLSVFRRLGTYYFEENNPTVTINWNFMFIC